MTEFVQTTTQQQTPLRMGKFAASKKIVFESWELMMKDKEIMLFPILSILSCLALLAILVSGFYVLALNSNWDNINHLSQEAQQVYNIVFLFLYYLVTFFTINFFDAGIITIVHGRFSGQNLDFSHGFKGASDNFGKIFVWSAIAAIVGVLIRMLSGKKGNNIISSMLGAAWSILTYFSLPVMIIGKKEVLESFPESAGIMKKMWGEAAIVNFGVSLFIMAIVVVVALILAAFAIMIPPTTVGWFTLGGVFGAFLVVVAVISSTLGVIFKLVLYEYATTGVVPQGFTETVVKNAIKNN